MSTPPLPPAAERLLDLLPQIFRIRDHEQAVRIAGIQGFDPPDPLADSAEGPLVTLLAALGQQFDLLEAEVDWLYEDQFIETCADWVVPYIGALVGARIVDVGDARSARLQVADTIRNRRARGTTRALANRAHDVMVAPAEAIEYAAHVARTWNPNFPGGTPATTVAINGAAGRALRLPTTLGQHVTELRDMREGGRFAPANVGTRVWTAQSVPHAEVVPFALSTGQAGRYRFDPLGRDIALWALPDDYVQDRSRLAVAQIPGAIPLVAAVDDPSAFYGPGKSVLIVIKGAIQPLSAICFCDLGDDGGPDQWNDHGSAAEKTRIRIDPRRGRFLLPGGGAGVAASDLRVRYPFGTALAAGGGNRKAASAQAEAALHGELGSRDRRPEPVDFSAPAIVAGSLTPAQADAALAATLGGLAAQPALRIDFGGTLHLSGDTTLPDDANIEIRAGEGVWPTLELGANWNIKGGRGSVLTLRGLRLAGAFVRVRAEGLRQLTLIDCTVVPGSARVVVEEPGCRLLAARSILGALRLAPSVEIDLLDSMVDSGGADVPAIAAASGPAAGILNSDRSTVIGDARLLAIDEVSDCIFAARPDRTNAGPPVSVQRLQSGCVRYSAVPRAAIVPRRYRCFPAPDDATSMEPVFASLDYSAPAYGVLVGANAGALLTGAENGGEPGIGNRASYGRRKRLLDRDLIDWVPFGMAAATELMNYEGG